MDMVNDASLLIDVLRVKDFQLLARMKSVDGTVCGVTRTEILSGARNEADRARLTTFLNGFLQLSLSEVVWDEVGCVQSILLANGKILPLADAVLITLGLSLDAEVWARDTHYQMAVHIFPALKLYQE